MALTESTRAGEFLLAEANGSISRDEITIAANAGALAAGTVLGKITLAAATATPDSGNVGDGAMGAITVGRDAQVGDYILTITEAATNAGTFQVVDPQGDVVGIGTVGQAFSGGGLSFTLADGTNDFSAGEFITITVAAGDGTYVAYDAANTDGSGVAAGILYAPVADSAAAQKAVGILRHAEVIEDMLTGNDAAGTLALAALDILVR